jgi:hypothetical protein
MTTPRPRLASASVTPSQSNHDTAAGTRWYSNAESVTVHTLDARLARIEDVLQRLVAHLGIDGGVPA